MITTSETIDEIVLVSLDCILETHLGTAALLDPKAPIDIIRNGYRQRDSNDLWEYTNLFDEKSFKEQWRSRNIETLKSSVLRNLITYIKSMLHIKTLDMMDRGGDIYVKVIINGFPYSLNNKLGSYMGKLIKNRLATVCEVIFISLDLTEITPKFLRGENINDLFLIDFNEWFKLHCEELDSVPSPSLSIYAPAMSKNLMKKIETAIDRRELDREFVKEINPFRASEIALAEHLSLNYLPIDIYSIPKL